MNGPFKKIAVYVDGSEASITAAMYAVVLAKTTGASLTALYVINTRALQDLVKARIFLQVEQDEYQHDLEADADRYLKHVRKLGEQKGVLVETVCVSGTVHREIKNHVKEMEADLLVVGGISQIRSRRDEIVNETERAMRSVPCPVLIVKDEDNTWDLFESLSE
jgi:nucleotide-binding universal stress UspA family protein